MFFDTKSHKGLSLLETRITAIIGGTATAVFYPSYITYDYCMSALGVLGIGYYFKT